MSGTLARSVTVPVADVQGTTVGAGIRVEASVTGGKVVVWLQDEFVPESMAVSVEVASALAETLRGEKPFHFVVCGEDGYDPEDAAVLQLVSAGDRVAVLFDCAARPVASHTCVDRGSAARAFRDRVEYLGQHGRT